MGRIKIHKSPARSHVEKGSQAIAEGKENDAFADETDILRRSAAENYFMQGKCGTMNKHRKGRRKVEAPAEENSSSDEDENGSADVMAKFSLQSLSKFVEETSAEKAKELEKVETNFSYWTNVYMESEFNICIIGAGAKNAVLDRYERHLASEGECTFVVEGFNEEASVRGIFQALNESLKLKKTARDIVKWAGDITQHLETKKLRVFMFLHNIDAPNLRDLNEQKALAKLSSTPWLRLITTVDHLNTTMMWDSTHTMSSLDILWQSLAENARKIFRIFFSMHYETGQSVPFWDLFNTARDDFLVSSDAALRLLLVEFEDHRVLTRRRREDGNENLIPCLDRALVEKFLTEKGISMEL